MLAWELKLDDKDPVRLCWLLRPEERLLRLVDREAPVLEAFVLIAVEREATELLVA